MMSHAPHTLQGIEKEMKTNLIFGGLIQRMGHFLLPTIGSFQHVQRSVDALCYIP